MRRTLPLLFAVAALATTSALAADDKARIDKGLEIAPVPLKLGGLDRSKVGLGSYIVNGQAGCNDCHTSPSYANGGDPCQGQPIKINKKRYLAGGREFPGGIVSANITPDARGLPHGLTLKQFLNVIHTGREPDDADEILQVMPWPIFRNMTDADLTAVYEYLRAIPSIGH